jgi:hypothetical protein
MNAEELFLEKGFAKSVNDTEVAFTKDNDFIKFGKTDYSYWTNLTDVEELKPAINAQLVEMGRL